MRRLFFAFAGLFALAFPVVSQASAPSDRTLPSFRWSYPTSNGSGLNYILSSSKPLRLQNLQSGWFSNAEKAKGCVFRPEAISATKILVRVTGCEAGLLQVRLAPGVISDLAGKRGPALPLLSTAPVSTLSGGNFAVDCGPTVRKALDPIVMPGMPGSSHLHEFFGPLDVGDNENKWSLAGRKKETTSCSLGVDQSAYWMPVFKYNGIFSDYRPQMLQVYYRLDQGAQAFPRGLVMIAGNAMQAGNKSNAQSASWSCQPSSNYDQTIFPDCSKPIGRYDSALAEIKFPSCWNGKNLDSTDHKSHVAYPEGDRCGPSYPVRLPRVVMFRSYSQDSNRILLPGLISLASGSPATLHADLVSAWEPSEMNQIIAKCSGRDCGHLSDKNSSLARSTAAVRIINQDNYRQGLFYWKPGRIAIRAGSRVSWDWKSTRDDPHNVISTDAKWSSGRAQSTGRWSRVFVRRGIFTYFCGVHPSMRGVIRVS